MKIWLFIQSCYHLEMNIKLVLANTKRKSLLFISNTFKILTLDDALRRAKKGELENVSVVRGKYGEYVRSLPNAFTKDNVDTLSVTAADIMAYVNGTRHFKSTDAISVYVAHYIASHVEADHAFIKTYDGHKAFVDQIRDLVVQNTSIIKQAAKEFNIDPYLLGSIVIDESVRLGAFEEVRDSFFLQLVGRNVSVGIAQLKLETANGLIKGEFYNPNPEDKKLPFIDQLRNDDRRYLYQYVSPPKHNLRFAAAFLRSLIDEWKSILDISKRPEVLGTFYSLSHQKPSTRPKILPRGRQIAEEFYGYAKKWLK